MADGNPEVHPLLSATAEVVFASRAQLHASAVWLRQGALIVRSEVPLAPLVEVQIQLSGAELTPLTLQARPVTQNGDAVMLQLIGLAPETVALFAQLGVQQEQPLGAGPQLGLAVPLPTPSLVLPAPLATLWPEAGGWTSVATWAEEPPGPAPSVVQPEAAPPQEPSAAGPALPPPLLAAHQEAPRLAAHQEAPLLAAHQEPPQLAAHQEPPQLAAHQEPPQLAAHQDLPFPVAASEPPAPAPAPPAARAVARPVLEQDLLRFLSVLDFDAALPSLRSGGTVLATSSLDAATERPVLLAAGLYLHPARLFAQLQPMGNGKAMVEFDDLPALEAELALIEQATDRERSAAKPSDGPATGA